MGPADLEKSWYLLLPWLPRGAIKHFPWDGGKVLNSSRAPALFLLRQAQPFHAAWSHQVRGSSPRPPEPLRWEVIIPAGNADVAGTKGTALP